jgi:hypothetical protein
MSSAAPSSFLLLVPLMSACVLCVLNLLVCFLFFCRFGRRALVIPPCHLRRGGTEGGF